MPEKRIMRLTWNSNNWETPSGHKWSKTKQGNSNVAHENQYGYGHEEWLFNPRHHHNGYQYGYIRGVNNLSIEVESIDQLILYTINPNTKERFVLGEIHNITIVEGLEDELDQVKPVFKQSLPHAIKELEAVRADYKHLAKNKDEFVPNIKFKMSDVNFYNQPLPSEFLKQARFNRFQAYKIDAEIEKALLKKQALDLKFHFTAGQLSIKTSYTKQTQQKQTTVERVHSNISDALYDYLLQEGFKKNQLSAEKTKVGAAVVDLAIQEGKNLYTLFEIKTHNRGLLNIRAALGQLFEYAFLDATISMKKLVIVGLVALNQKEIDYLSTINQHIDIKLEYWAWDGDTNFQKY